MLSIFYLFFVLSSHVEAASIPLATINGKVLSQEEAQLILDKKTPLSPSDIEKAVLFELAVNKALSERVDQEPATATSLKKVLYKAYLRNISAQNAKELQVSPEELRTYYESYPLLRVSQLILKGSPEKNLAKLKNIRADFKQGIPFRRLVLKYSEDATALQGGDIDYRSIHNFPEPLYQVIQRTPKNALSEPVAEGKNTLVFLWSDKKRFQDAPQTYKSFLSSRISEQRELALLRENLGELRKNAKVEILPGETP